jgi:hypothetical protein
MPRRLSLVLVVTVALGVAAARAGIEPGIIRADLKTYSCRELLTLEEPRRNLVVTYFSGYMDGQRNAGEFDVKAKSDVIDKVLEHCRGNAAGSVLEAFRRLTP